jgi:hypothetical protein
LSRRTRSFRSGRRVLLAIGSVGSLMSIGSVGSSYRCCRSGRSSIGTALASKSHGRSRAPQPCSASCVPPPARRLFSTLLTASPASSSSRNVRSGLDEPGADGVLGGEGVAADAEWSRSYGWECRAPSGARLRRVRAAPRTRARLPERDRRRAGPGPRRARESRSEVACRGGLRRAEGPGRRAGSAGVERGASFRHRHPGTPAARLWRHDPTAAVLRGLDPAGSPNSGSRTSRLVHPDPDRKPSCAKADGDGRT